MDNIYAWTLILCFSKSPDLLVRCDPHQRIVVTSTRVFDSETACEAGWKAHLARLRALPGWGGLKVQSYLCGWGTAAVVNDPLYDLREENAHGS